MKIISPDFLEIVLTAHLPATLAGYRIANSTAMFGETLKAKYLFQDLHLALYHACFINIFSVKQHIFYLLKHTPTYYLLIQLEQSLQCKYQNLFSDTIYEWGINLYHTSKLFVEISCQDNRDYSTFIFFIPDETIKKLAPVYPVIKKIEQQELNANHTIQLFKSSPICSFKLMDIIKAIKTNEPMQGVALANLVTIAFDLFAQKKLPKQKYVEPVIANKIYSLKKFMQENTTNQFTRTQLAKEYNLSYYHFDKTFCKIYHSTPFRLLKYFRMTEAIDELHRNKKNIKELAARYHYSYNSFIRAFQSIYQQHPTKYKPIIPYKRKPRSSYKRKK